MTSLEARQKLGLPQERFAQLMRIGDYDDPITEIEVENDQPAAVI